MSKDGKSSDDMLFSAAILLAICMAVTFAYRIFIYTIIPFSVRFYFYHWWLSMFTLATSLTAVLGIIIYGISILFGSIRGVNEGKKPNSSRLCMGHDKKGKSVFVTLDHRKMHTQVIGSTNAGKTESVIVPWAVDDIRNGRGLILIDGKSERKLLEKLWGYAVKYGRSDDFLFFSLADTAMSRTFNPLIGDDPEEVVERVFSAMEFDNGYYKNIQRTNLAQILRLFRDAGELPTFARILESITAPDKLMDLADKTENQSLKTWTEVFKNNPKRIEDNSGLTSQLSTFANGSAGRLFNDLAPEIDLEEILAKNKIVYFQLPAMKHPFLGRATGKLVLQALQSAVSSRHLSGREHKFFSVYLDDFTEYLYEGFVTLLNKSRSANVGIVFAHQAIGDLQAIGEAAANSILTNSNVKIVMRSNAPDTAEYFAKVIGTKTTDKHTERKKRSFMGEDSTGDISARQTEEYKFHPQIFKEQLGPGSAIVVLPDNEGTKSYRVELTMLPDPSESQLIPNRNKSKTRQGAKNEKTA
jgi:type IV secretory pathway TraG/TraD family ATPase VirD4